MHFICIYIDERKIDTMLCILYSCIGIVFVTIIVYDINVGYRSLYCNYYCCINIISAIQLSYIDILPLFSMKIYN